MEKIKFSAELDVFEDRSKLPQEIQHLMSQAVEARNNAYAPYSSFKVGAALLLENNETVIGSNQENASYPSGLCAERTAIYYAGAKYPQKAINAMAISAKSLNREIASPIPPCGACRQAISEYEVNQEKGIPVYFMGEKGKVYKAKSIKDLLPFIFDKFNL